MNQGHGRTLGAAIGGATIISFSAIFFAAADVTPVTGAFYRAGYAIPILVVLWWRGRAQDRRPRSRRWLGVGAGLALGADIISWHSSIDLIGAGLATLLANTAVVFVAIGAWLLLGERPRKVTLITIPVILTGVGLISGIGQSDPFGENPAVGALLALVAALFYATFILGFRHANEDQAPAAGPLLEASIGAVLATAAFGVLSGELSTGWQWPAHGWLLALALGPQVIGWLLIGYALPRLPAVETATVILIQPAMTLAWGAVFLSERPSTLQILGALVVLGGVGVVAWSRAARSGGDDDDDHPPHPAVDDSHANTIGVPET